MSCHQHQSPIEQQTTFSNRQCSWRHYFQKYKNHVQLYASELRSSAMNELIKTVQSKRSISADGRLKVAWVIGDLAPHPVSRFVYQFFAGSRDHTFVHDHVLVNTFNHGKESCKQWFEGLPNFSIVDVSAHHAAKRVAAIRAIEADIAIDLSLDV